MVGAVDSGVVLTVAIVCHIWQAPAVRQCWPDARLIHSLTPVLGQRFDRIIVLIDRRSWRFTQRCAAWLDGEVRLKLRHGGEWMELL